MTAGLPCSAGPPSPASGVRRYRVAGLVVETALDVPHCGPVLTRALPDVRFNHGVPWNRAPGPARALGPSPAGTRHRVSRSAWISADQHGNWVECGRFGRVRAGFHPSFDWRRRQAPGAEQYWAAILAAGLTGLFIGAYGAPGRVGVHAAAAAPHARGPGILLTGPSGAGKSTIATALQRTGWWWIAREATAVTAPAAVAGPWRVESEWPVKHVSTPGRPKWPTFIPAGPRFLPGGAPLGAVYWLADRHRPNRVRITPASPAMGVRLRREARLYTLLGWQQPGCLFWMSPRWADWDAHGPPVFLVERPASYKAPDTAPYLAEHALEILSATVSSSAVPVS